MADKYWALVDLRYPAGEAEHEKALKGERYREVVVKAGEPLTEVSEATIRAYHSMGRKIVTKRRPKAAEPVKVPEKAAERTKAVKT